MTSGFNICTLALIALIATSGCVLPWEEEDNYPSDLYQDKTQKTEIEFFGINPKTNDYYCEKPLLVYGENEEGHITENYITNPAIQCQEQYDTLNKTIYEDCDSYYKIIYINKEFDGRVWGPTIVYVIDDMNGDKPILREIWQRTESDFDYFILKIAFDCEVTE